MAIYKAQVSTIICDILVAVDSNEDDARHDLASALQAITHEPHGMSRIGEVQKSNRHILAKMTPVRQCRATDRNGDLQYWSWWARI